MNKNTKHGKRQTKSTKIGTKEYHETLHVLQVELVKLQKHFIHCNDKILVIFEGRDAAGKDGVIKRIVEHLSPRETRVVALGKPSDHTADHGTSSVSFRTCRRRRSSCCSIAVGTTGPE